VSGNEQPISATTILNIIPDERLGGPQLRVFQVARRLKEKGFTTIVAMPEGDTTFADMLSEARIPCYQVKNYKRQPANFGSLILWFLYLIPAVISLMRLIRSNKVAVVHVNGITNGQAFLAAKLSGRRMVWHLNGYRPKWLSLMMRPLLRIFSNEVVGASKAIYGYYLGGIKVIEDTSVLYPPIDTNRFHPDSSAGNIRGEFGLNGHDKVVGIVANINPVKGYKHFFGAAKLITQALPETKFLVVGKRLETQEKYWHTLHQMIVDSHLEKNVIFAGHRDDIPQIMNSLDVFVLTSIAEAAPIVVLEAMACAKPVVAARVGGVPELVIDGETGILVPPKDPEAIAEAVLALLVSPEKAKVMGQSGRKRVIEKFDIEICVQKHEDLYRSVS